MDYLLLIVGFALLIKASDLLVDGSSTLAQHFGMSDFVVGLTVVAFATSLPELVVNVLAVINSTSGMALGNVIGSNTLNIFIVIGITAAIGPIAIHRKAISKEIILTILLSIVLLMLIQDRVIFGAIENKLSRADGMVLLGLFVAFLTFVLTKKKNPELAPKISTKYPARISLRRAAIYILIGICGLFLGGKLIVDSASAIALSFGMSDTVVGLTVVAIGTSMPEVATSILAGRKGSSEMAVGNVLGSNLFNGLLILGSTATLAPIHIGVDFSPIDLYVTILGCVLLLMSVLIWQKVSRWLGVMFIAMYMAYVTYLLVNI